MLIFFNTLPPSSHHPMLTSTDTPSRRPLVLLAGTNQRTIKQCLLEILPIEIGLREDDINLPVPFHIQESVDRNNFIAELEYRKQNDVATISRDYEYRHLVENEVRRFLSDIMGIDRSMKMSPKELATSYAQMETSGTTVSGPTVYNVLKLLEAPLTESCMWILVKDVRLSGNFDMSNLNLVVLPSARGPVHRRQSMDYYEAMIEQYCPTRILFCLDHNDSILKSTDPKLVEIHQKYKSIVQYVVVSPSENAAPPPLKTSKPNDPSGSSIVAVKEHTPVAAANVRINYVEKVKQWTVEHNIFDDENTHFHPVFTGDRYENLSCSVMYDCRPIVNK